MEEIKQYLVGLGGVVAALVGLHTVYERLRNSFTREYRAKIAELTRKLDQALEREREQGQKIARLEERIEALQRGRRTERRPGRSRRNGDAEPTPTS